MKMIGMKTRIGMLAWVPALMILASCEKSQVATNKLAGATWEISSLKVAGVAQDDAHLPEFSFDDCDVSEDLCTGKAFAHGSETEYAEFLWQISEEAKKFELSNQTTLPVDPSHDLEEAIIACQNLSGLWVIQELSRSELKVTSSGTLGYPGEEVEMILEKE